MRPPPEAAVLPGLVFQYLLRADGSAAFTYLSENCEAVLGISADALRADPSLLEAHMLPEDRASYRSSMLASATSSSTWNWEGRIRIEAWHDIKWVNLRSNPCRAEQDGVQWDGIIVNITRSKQQELEKRLSGPNTAELAAHVEAAREQERMRIAREIHDGLGGDLAAIKMAIAMLARRLPEGAAELAERASYATSLVDRSIDELHRIAANLRPAMLELGLIPALEWQAGEFQKQSGITCSFMAGRAAVRIDDERATSILRILQEALSNIGKHAGATLVLVQLEADDTGLQLEVRDNGSGIRDADRKKPGSFGLRSMQERAQALEGELQLSANPEGGTLLRLHIPAVPVRSGT